MLVRLIGRENAPPGKARLAHSHSSRGRAYGTRKKFGARIAIVQITALGAGLVALVIVGVVAIIGFGAWLGRRLEPLP
jgi:hypothetical protein